MKLRGQSFFLLLMIAFSCGWSAATCDAESADTSLQERRAARAVLGKYRRARRDLDAKQRIVQEAISLGPPVVEQLFPLIEEELDPQLTRYRQQFYKSAQAAAIKKFKEANLEEVAQLRGQVNALRENDNLTKQMIVEQGDPAMERLEQLLILDRETVLSSNQRLVDQRADMAGIGRLWELCQTYLASVPTSDPPGDDVESPPSAVSFEEYLQEEETLAVRLAIPMTDNTRAVLAANSKLTSRIAPEEARCVLALNLTRILLGLEPLMIDVALTQAARGHAADMRTHNFFAHQSPVPGKTTPWDRAKLAGTTASGENIAMGPRGNNGELDVVSQSAPPSQHAR